MTFPSEPALRTMTVDAWAQQWYPTRQRLRQSTSVRNLSLYATHIKPALGHLNLSDITTQQVQGFVDALTSKPVSRPASDGGTHTLAPSTVRETYQELGKCLNAARQAGHLRHNPCRGVTLPKIERQDMNLLNQQEVHALAAAIDARYTALIYLLAHIGLRIGEAAALEPFDFDGRGITVTKTAAEVKGELVTSALTTNAAQRVVPLPDLVAAQLVQHVETYPGAYLFTGRDGGQVRSNVFRARQFSKARQVIGRPDLRIYDLRHTAVALWITQGVDLPRIQRWAGHTSASFTITRYGHLLSDRNEAPRRP